MKLADWLKSEGISRREFSRRSGIPYFSLTQWERRKRRPNLEALQKLDIHTDGKVTQRDFYHLLEKEVADG